MCKIVWAESAPDPMIGTVGELMALAGCDDIRDVADFTDGDIDLEREDCLCQVNVAEFLVECGYRVWKEPRGDPMMVHCEPVALLEEERHD